MHTFRALTLVFVCALVAAGCRGEPPKKKTEAERQRAAAAQAEEPEGPHVLLTPKYALSVTPPERGAAPPAAEKGEGATSPEPGASPGVVAVPAPDLQAPAHAKEGAFACPDGTKEVQRVDEAGNWTWCEDAASVRNGPWVLRWESGQAKTAGTFRNGQQHGPWAAWYEDGTRKALGEFRDGKQYGTWQMWNEDGALR